MMDDLTAIKKCQQEGGEGREAFRYLVERYQNQAVAHAVAIFGAAGNREDARDAVQEAFIDAFQSIKRFDASRRFYPWFYVLLRNRCFKMMAKRKENIEISEETEILAAPQPAVSREETLALEKALRSLPEANREIVTLKYLDGLSYDEIAEYLNIPRGTVMSRLFHARKALQAKLAERF